MQLLTLFQGILAAERHRGGIKCLQLFEVDPDALAELTSDVMAVCRSERPSDASHPDHVTAWTRPQGEVVQFSLLNASGRLDDFSRDHDASTAGKRFHADSSYPTLARFVSAFPDTVNFRIAVLGPRSSLPPHEEHTLIRTRTGGVGARLRFHLPIVTNAGAELNLDGDVYHLAAGICAFVNHGCVHAASNAHDREARIHLVWDMLLTRESFECMFVEREPAFALRRIAFEDQMPRRRRFEPVGSYARIPAAVPPNDASRLALCDSQ